MSWRLWCAVTAYLGVSAAATRRSPTALRDGGWPLEGETGGPYRALSGMAAGEGAHTDAGLARPKVSLVLMNFSRPKNVEMIAATVANYTHVDEIIVWNVHPHPHHLPQIVQSEKVTLIHSAQSDLDAKWGLMTRFKTCLLARNEWVVVQDDDLIMSEQAIDRLVTAKTRQPDLVVCYESRQTFSGLQADSVGYHIAAVEAPARVPICLTQNLLTDRRYCLATIRHAADMEDLAQLGHPYWNGEDILHSLVAQRETGVAPLVLPRRPGGQTQLAAPDGISMQPRDGGFDHYRFRDHFTREAVARLQLQPTDLVWRKAPEFDDV